MCFIRETGSFPKTSRGPVKCFKILEKEPGSERGEYQSIHYFHIYRTGKTYTHKDGNRFDSWSMPTQINGQGFHSFRTRSIAAHHLNEFGTCNQVIVECLIPKGVEYLTNEKEFVSRAIRVVRKSVIVKKSKKK